MSEIPDDIMKVAWDAAGHVYDPYSRPGAHTYVRDLIAKAIHAERQRHESAPAVRRGLSISREEFKRLVDEGKAFADTDPEARFIADAKNCCPHCGGSGHKDDLRDQWQPVTGYEGKYEVSDRGVIRKADGSIVGQWPNTNGYLLARLSDPRAVVRVHRVVAEAFKEKPAGAEVVNHIDCDPANNNAWNLEWCTQAENLAHMDALGRRVTYWTGKRSPKAILTDEQAEKLRRARADEGISFSQLAKRFGVSKRVAQRCVSGETYRPLPPAPKGGE